MALERGEVTAGRIAPEPLGGGRARAAAQRRLERRERTADVVEHPVQDDAQAAAAAPRRSGGRSPPGRRAWGRSGSGRWCRNRGSRRRRPARAAGPSSRARRHSPATRQLPQPVPDGLFGRRFGLLGTGEAQRVHVPEDGVIGPRRHPANDSGGRARPARAPRTRAGLRRGPPGRSAVQRILESGPPTGLPAGSRARSSDRVSGEISPSRAAPPSTAAARPKAAP